MKGKTKAAVRNTGVTALLALVMIVVAGSCTKKTETAAGDGVQAAVSADLEMRQDSYGFSYMDRPNVQGAMVEYPMDLKGRTIYIGTGWPNAYPTREQLDGSGSTKAIAVLRSIEKDYNCKFEIVDTSVAGYEAQNIVQMLTVQKAAGAINIDWLDIQNNQNPGKPLFIDFMYPAENIVPIKNQPQGTWTNWEYLPDAYLVDGKRYAAQIDGSGPWGSVRTAVVFNRDLAERYGIENMYDLVRTKKWTFDKFREIIETVYDKSGGATVGITKTWRVPRDFFRSFLMANDANPFQMQGGRLITSVGTEKALVGAQFVADLLSRGLLQNTEWETSLNTFYSGGSFFYFIENYELSDMKNKPSFDVGLLPHPMGPDAQDYTTHVNIYRGWLFVNNGKSMDESGAVFVAYHKRMGAYYPDFDNSYEENSWRDDMAGLLDYNEDDLEMLDVIANSLEMDQTYMLIDNGGFDAAINAIGSGEATVKEAFDQVKNSVQAQVDEFNNYR
jgi:hypothetical protein